MKYLPQMAISWETAVVFSLSCLCLGAALCALALRRTREKQATSAVIEFTTAKGKGSSEKQNGAEPETIGALAESLWLRRDPPPEVLVLSDSGPEAGPAFEHLQTRAFWAEEIEPHRRHLERRRELAVIEKVLLTLDRHGICSSVVAGDGKSAFKPTARRFSRVTLLDHSLRVARHG